MARWLLTATVFYTLIASFAVQFSLPHPWNAWSAYYHLVLLLAATLSLRELRHTKFPKLRAPARSELFCILGLGALGLAAWILYRQPILFRYAIWYDEITQFRGGLHYFASKPHRDLMWWAAFQQQPPADYYLSNFARIFFGDSETSVLCHTIAFAALSYFAFLFWLRQIRFPWPLLPVPIVLFAGHHVLLEYTSEARPISSGVFYGLLVLIFAQESLQKKAAQVQPLLVSSLMLLFSIGLQPVFFLACISLSFFPLLWNQWSKREAVRFYLSVAVGPMVIFLPSLVHIYLASQEANQFLPDSHFRYWWAGLLHLKLSDFAVYESTLEGALWLLGIPPALLCLGLIQRLRKKKAPTYLLWAIAATLFAFSFPFFFQIFWTTINWKNFARYFVLWPVGLFAFVTASVAEWVNHGLPRWTYAAMGSLALAMSVALHAHYIPLHLKKIYEFRTLHPHWEEIFAMASADANSELPNLFIEFPFSPLGDHAAHHILTTPIYKTPMKRPLDLEWQESFNKFNRTERLGWAENFYRVTERLRTSEHKANLFFLIPTRVQDYPELPALLHHLTPYVDEILHERNGFPVLRLSHQASPTKTTFFLFEKIISFKPESSWNFYLAETLAAEAQQSGNAQERKRAVERLRKISLAGLSEERAADVKTYIETLLLPPVKD